jgi:hypothetical protein
MVKPMNTGSASNARSFLGGKEAPTIFGGRVDFSGRISRTSVGRRSPTQFSKMQDDSKYIDESPPSPACSSLTSRSTEDIDSCSQSSSSVEDSSIAVHLNTPQHGISSSPSRPQESLSVLEFINDIDDIEASYMLSVFWNAGDSDAVRDSVAGHSRCSYASTSTASTSMTSYTHTSSRSRHKGAYKKRSRVIKEAPNASWIDTMEDSSALRLGFRNSWSATRGWTQTKDPAWDPKPDPSRWESLNPLFDIGERIERLEI